MGIVTRFASEDYVKQNLQNLKYEAVLTTPQELTDAQKIQARANLGISENINSEPVITNYEYTYNTLTIGDLRSGRNLKYKGKMYNVSIYGRALTEAEVLKNYEDVKKELGI